MVFLFLLILNTFYSNTIFDCQRIRPYIKSRRQCRHARRRTV